MAEFVRRTNGEGECALHYAGRIKKNVLHFPKEDAMIMQLLMEHGSDVMAQTKTVSNMSEMRHQLKLNAREKTLGAMLHHAGKKIEGFETHFRIK
jgi:hypothetical protein